MADNPSAAIGANVRVAMARVGMTQTDLAAVLGISQPAVSARLRGVVAFNVDEIIDVAAHLGVPVDQLLDRGTSAPLLEEDRS